LFEQGAEVVKVKLFNFLFFFPLFIGVRLDARDVSTAEDTINLVSGWNVTLFGAV